MERKYILKGGFSLVFDREVNFLGFEIFFFLKKGYGSRSRQ